MTNFTELFDALLYGSGAWLGLLIILSICFLVTYKVKYSGVVFMFPLLFMAWEYGQHLAASSNMLWGIVACVFSMLIILYKVLMDARA